MADGNNWRICATLYEAAGGALRLGLIATREGENGPENTSESLDVIDESDARREARAFARLLSAEDYAWEDKRAA